MYKQAKDDLDMARAQHALDLREQAQELQAAQQARDEARQTLEAIAVKNKLLAEARDGARAESARLQEDLQATCQELSEARAVILQAAQMRAEEEAVMRERQSRAEALEGRVQQLEAALAEANSSLDNSETAAQELTASKDALAEEVERLQEQLQAAESRVTEATARAREVEDEGNYAQGELHMERSDLRCQLNAARAREREAVDAAKNLWMVLKDGESSAAFDSPATRGEALVECIQQAQCQLHRLRLQSRLVADALTSLAEHHLYEGDAGLQDLDAELREPLAALHDKFEAMEAEAASLARSRDETNLQLNNILQELTREVGLYKEAADEMRRHAAIAREEYEENSRALTAQLVTAEHALADAQSLVSALETEASDLRARLSAAEAAQTALELEVAAKQESLEALRPEAAEASVRAELLAQKRLEASEALDAKTRECAELLRAKAAVDDKIAGLEAKAAAVSADTEVLVAGMASAMEQLRAAQESYEVTRVQKEQAMEELQTVMAAHSRAASDAAALADALQRSDARLQAALQECAHAAAALSAAERRAEVADHDNSALRRECVSLQRELSERLSALDEQERAASSFRGCSAREWCFKYEDLLRRTEAWRPVQVELVPLEELHAVEVHLVPTASEEMGAAPPFVVRSWAGALDASRELQQKGLAIAEYALNTPHRLASTLDGTPFPTDRPSQALYGLSPEGQTPARPVAESYAEQGVRLASGALYDEAGLQRSLGSAELSGDLFSQEVYTHSDRLKSMFKDLDEHEFFRSPNRTTTEDLASLEEPPLDDPVIPDADEAGGHRRLEQNVNVLTSLLADFPRSHLMGLLSSNPALLKGSADIFDECSIKQAAEAQFLAQQGHYASQHLLSEEVSQIADNIEKVLRAAASARPLSPRGDAASSSSDDEDSAALIGEKEQPLLDMIRSNVHSLQQCEQNLMALWAQASLLEVQQVMLRQRQHACQRDCEAAQTVLETAKNEHNALLAREQALQAEVVGAPKPSPEAIKILRAVREELQQCAQAGKDKVEDTQQLLAEIVDMDHILEEWQAQADVFADDVKLTAANAEGYAAAVKDLLAALQARLARQHVDILPCMLAVTDKLEDGPAPGHVPLSEPLSHPIHTQSISPSGEYPSGVSTSTSSSSGHADAHASSRFVADTPITKLAHLGVIWPGHSPGSAPRRPSDPRDPRLMLDFATLPEDVDAVTPAIGQSSLSGIVTLGSSGSEPHGLLDGLNFSHSNNSTHYTLGAARLAHSEPPHYALDGLGLPSAAWGTSSAGAAPSRVSSVPPKLQQGVPPSSGPLEGRDSRAGAGDVDSTLRSSNGFAFDTQLAPAPPQQRRAANEASAADLDTPRNFPPSAQAAAVPFHTPAAALASAEAHDRFFTAQTKLPEASALRGDAAAAARTAETRLGLLDLEGMGLLDGPTSHDLVLTPPDLSPGGAASLPAPPFSPAVPFPDTPLTDQQQEGFTTSTLLNGERAREEADAVAATADAPASPQSRDAHGSSAPAPARYATETTHGVGTSGQAQATASSEGPSATPLQPTAPIPEQHEPTPPISLPFSSPLPAGMDSPVARKPAAPSPLVSMSPFVPAGGPLARRSLRQSADPMRQSFAADFGSFQAAIAQMGARNPRRSHPERHLIFPADPHARASPHDADPHSDGTDATVSPPLRENSNPLLGGEGGPPEGGSGKGARVSFGGTEGDEALGVMSHRTLPLQSVSGALANRGEDASGGGGAEQPQQPRAERRRVVARRHGSRLPNSSSKDVRAKTPPLGGASNGNTHPNSGRAEPACSVIEGGDSDSDSDCNTESRSFNWPARASGGKPGGGIPEEPPLPDDARSSSDGSSWGSCDGSRHPVCFPPKPGPQSLH